MYSNHSYPIYRGEDDGRSYLLRKFFIFAVIAAIFVTLVAYANDRQAAAAQAAADQAVADYQALERQYSELLAQFASVQAELDRALQDRNTAHAEINRLAAERDHLRGELDASKAALAEAQLAQQQAESDLQALRARNGDLARLVVEQETALTGLNAQNAALREENNQWVREAAKTAPDTRPAAENGNSKTTPSRLHRAMWLLLPFVALVAVGAQQMQRARRKKGIYLKVTAEEMAWIRERRRKRGG